MRNEQLKLLIIFLFLLILTISPFALRSLIISGKRILVAKEYSKIKIRVDSLATHTPISSEGGHSYTNFYIYNFDKSLFLEISNEERVLIKSRDGKENLVSHMLKYMKNHNDSIWIWYHPRAEPKYAKVEEKEYPITEDVLSLGTNIIIVVLAIYAIYWQINYNRKNRKKKKQAI